MTVASETSFVRYTGDGTTVAFTITYPFQEASDIRLFVDNTLVTTGFTVTGGSPTGTLTFDTAPDNGADVFIRRLVPILQDKAYPTNDTFPSVTHEAALDKLTYIAQQQQRNQLLSLSFPESLNITSALLPAPEDDKILAFNGVTGAIKAGPTTASFETATSTATTAAATATSAASAATTQAGIATTQAAIATAAAASIDLPTLGAADTVLQVNAGGTALEYGKVDTGNIEDGAVTVAKIDSASATDGHVLTADGAGGVAFEAISGAGLVLLGSYTASNSTSVDIGSGLDINVAINSTYDVYVVLVNNAIPQTDAVDAYIRTGNGGTFDSGSTDYRYGVYSIIAADSPNAGAVSATDASAVILTDAGIGNTSTEGLSGSIFIYNSQTTSHTRFLYNLAYGNSGEETILGFSGGARKEGAVHDRFRFLFSSGNITSGTFYLYGIRKS